MDDLDLLTGHFWTLQNVPDLNIKGIQRVCVDICYQIILLCQKLCCFCTFTYVNLLNIPGVIGPSTQTFFYYELNPTLF